MRNTKRIILLLVALMAATSIAGGVALAAEMNGGDGDNTIRGTAEADTINGNDGKDIIYGMEGDDEIDGGERGDRLYGGDEVMGLTGDDHISGRAGDDKIFGGPGADRLGGGYDADIIREGPEDDASVDAIVSGPGGDQIYAANGSQVADVISCQDGQDKVQADPADQVASDCEVVEVVKEISVDLAGEKSVEQALQVADSVDAAPEELVANYEVGEDNYGFGYVLTDTEPMPSAEEVTQTMISAFQEDIEMLQETSLPTAPDQDTATPDQATATPDQWAETPEAELAEEEATTSDLESVIDTVQSSGAKVDEMTVQTATSVDQIEQNPAVESAVDTSSFPPEEDTAQPDNDNGS